MKKASSIRKLLGISQTDIAKLLKVHRSQYSMFEIGKRGLPRDANLLITKMLQHTAKPTEAKTLNDFVETDSAKQYLTEMLLENKLQRLRCAKKLSALRKTQEKNHAILRMAGFLAKSAKKEHEHYKEHIALIERRAERAMKGCDDSVLMRYEIQMKLLEYERKLLEDLIAKKTDSI